MFSACLRAFFIPSSHSAYMCAHARLPILYKPVVVKITNVHQKKGVGYQRRCLATFVAGSSFQPPPGSFFGASNYIDFAKSGNVGKELPLQNRFLYMSGFAGETGRPRFFHIFPLQNGSLYF